jgi:mannose-1-phosphate guanylyltransferase
LEATAQAVPSVPSAHLLAEPTPRNTAPCIGWATATIHRKDPDALIAVLPSDHFIQDEVRFRETVALALDIAKDGYLTTIGIAPTRPETGYGYIETGAELRDGVNAVARFVEKPNAARAEEFLAGGKHLWNAGMFFFRSKDMLASIAKHLPELATGLTELDAAAARGDEAAALREVFPQLPSISIDHGVMEKASPLAVVRGDFGWNDVGGWQSTWELATKDAVGNALAAGSFVIDGEGNLVRDLSRSPKKVIALVGVSNLVVVETDEDAARVAVHVIRGPQVLDHRCFAHSHSFRSAPIWRTPAPPRERWGGEQSDGDKLA